MRSNLILQLCVFVLFHVKEKIIWERKELWSSGDHIILCSKCPTDTEVHIWELKNLMKIWVSKHLDMDYSDMFFRVTKIQTEWDIFQFSGMFSTDLFLVWMQNVGAVNTSTLPHRGQSPWGVLMPRWSNNLSLSLQQIQIFDINLQTKLLTNLSQLCQHVWFCSIWCPAKINIGLTKEVKFL